MDIEMVAVEAIDVSESKKDWLCSYDLKQLDLEAMRKAIDVIRWLDQLPREIPFQHQVISDLRFALEIAATDCRAEIPSSVRALFGCDKSGEWKNKKQEVSNGRVRIVRRG